MRQSVFAPLILKCDPTDQRPALVWPPTAPGSSAGGSTMECTLPQSLGSPCMHPCTRAFHTHVLSLTRRGPCSVLGPYRCKLFLDPVFQSTGHTVRGKQKRVLHVSHLLLDTEQAPTGVHHRWGAARAGLTHVSAV